MVERTPVLGSRRSLSQATKEDNVLSLVISADSDRKGTLLLTGSETCKDVLIAHEFAISQLPDFLSEPLDKAPVMRHRHYWPWESQQCNFKLLEGIQAHMICRLVKQQQIGMESQ